MLLYQFGTDLLAYWQPHKNLSNYPLKVSHYIHHPMLCKLPYPVRYHVCITNELTPILSQSSVCHCRLVDHSSFLPIPCLVMPLLGSNSCWRTRHTHFTNKCWSYSYWAAFCGGINLVDYAINLILTIYNLGQEASCFEQLDRAASYGSFNWPQLAQNAVQ